MIQKSSVHTQKGKSHFFLSFLFLGKRKRAAIRSVYSFLRAADDDVDQSGSEGRSLLSQRLAQLDMAYDGQPTEPDVLGLQQAIKEFGLPRQEFLKVFEGLRMDLDGRQYDSIDELYEYCDCVAGAVGQICLPIFGRNDSQAVFYARELGRGLQLTNILRDLGGDARKGRIYLPLQDRERFHVKNEDFLSHHASQNMKDLVRYEARIAWGCLGRARAAAREQGGTALLTPEIMRATYQRLLRIVESMGPGALQEQVRLSLPVQAWTGMTTAISCYLGL